MATSFSGGRSQSTQREPPTMGKQLVSWNKNELGVGDLTVYSSLYDLPGNEH